APCTGITGLPVGRAPVAAGTRRRRARRAPPARPPTPAPGGGAPGRVATRVLPESGDPGAGAPVGVDRGRATSAAATSAVPGAERRPGSGCRRAHRQPSRTGSPSGRGTSPAARAGPGRRPPRVRGPARESPVRPVPPAVGLVHAVAHAPGGPRE